MKLMLDRSTLENLLHQAASAAQIVGHLDDNAQPDLIHQLSDRVDTITHGLTELLGAPSALAEPDAAAAPRTQGARRRADAQVHRGRCPMNH